MKYLVAIIITLSIAACGAPKPPCCTSTGMDLHPINPEYLVKNKEKPVAVKNITKDRLRKQ
ncbi:MAG: hypothetical protein PHG20_00310 [Geobacteraceae bacterium]|nr:hypothetical protein [Geobacteraceae bacterium]